VIPINSESKKIKTFPLRLEEAFNDNIDEIVYLTKAKSKQQYILNAVKNQIEKDREGLVNGKAIQR
jgi:hypothetical protein